MEFSCKPLLQSRSQCDIEKYPLTHLVTHVPSMRNKISADHYNKLNTVDNQCTFSQNVCVTLKIENTVNVIRHFG